jgi:hypothetical protein
MIMKMKRWPGLSLAGLSLALATLSGCQTWTSGMTLPSGRYLQHPPQYFPPSPPFPLPREQAALERMWTSDANGEAVGPLPVPVPAAPQEGAGFAPLPPP